MNQQALLRQMKVEMKRWIDNMEIDNCSEIQTHLTSYFEIISLMRSLPEAPRPIKTNRKEHVPNRLESNENPIQTSLFDSHSEEESTAEKELEKKEELSAPSSKESSNDEVKIEKEDVYIFERKLRGGILSDISAFIPEGIVRKLSLENGDKVKARKMEDASDDSKNRYHYSLIEKGEGKDAPDRKQLDYCIVEKEAGSLVVKESRLSGEEIRYNGVSYPTVLSDNDIRYFSIREGDIIDIAYKKQNPAEHKVLWKHEDVELPETKSVESPKKKKGNDISSEMVEPVSQSLSGMNILIVGNEGSRTSYQEQIEKRGGGFMWVDAKEKVEKFPPLVKKATFVVFLLGLSGHTGMKKIKQLCKEQNIPFEATFHQGITSITRLVEDLADRNKKESLSALS